jgi:6-phosphofructokinase 2
MNHTKDKQISILCLNPALDVTYHVEKLIVDQKSRSTVARHDPGGNGINIGRALLRLGVDATTFCIIAGSVGESLKQMLSNQLEHIVYEQVSGETRINSTIIELASKTQYQITDAGTDIPFVQLNKVTSDFISASGSGYAILTGSCQPNVPVRLYADLIEKLNLNGARAIVDTHGEALKQAIHASPFLIKPNRFELETLLSCSLPTPERVAHKARALQLSGVSHVCVSLGEDGAVLVSPDNSYFSPALNVKVNTTVGAGDSMVAGLVTGFADTDSPVDALRYGISCGAGTVIHPGTELFSKEEVNQFIDQVNIQTLDI